MSNRGPATYAPSFADATALAAFVSAVPSFPAPSAYHHIIGIEVGADGVLAGSWSAPPDGLPATFSRDVDAGRFYEIAPASIDGANTTCWPIVVHYGPLGLGAR